MFELFATAAKGTEGVLRDELKSLHLSKVKAERGGVRFAGSLADGMRACFETRIAQRVLWLQASFEAPSEQALYEGVQTVDWSHVLDARRTLSVSATIKSSALRHSGYVALKTKDAIVDQLRARTGRRPDVDRDDPDVHVTVHLDRDVATVYVDLSGKPLHRRGYRTEAREAPLKETLAAAILRLSGWDREAPLVDPMCGSGTIPIEAYLWAHDIAPGLLRKDHGFTRFATFDDTQRLALSCIKEAARDRVKKDGPTIVGLDIDRDAIALSKRLAKRASVDIHFEHCPIHELMGTDPPGFVVTNPPYGVRLSRGDDFEVMLARAFRSLRGHRISAICHDPKLADAMRIPPTREHTLFNGDLECRLFSWSP
jgi:putative N6-adenine-specific DNA methylase